MAFLNDTENAFEILNPWLVTSRKWELYILASNLPGPGPVFLTPLGKRLACSKIIAIN